MGIEDIKEEILALHFRQIGPLYMWLDDYLHKEIWPREMQADIEEMGEEQWAAALAAGMAQAGEKRQAALRLMNSLQFKSDADREQCIHDFQLVIGEALAD
jgi:hypothetical protein